MSNSFKCADVSGMAKNIKQNFSASNFSIFTFFRHQLKHHISNKHRFLSVYFVTITIVNCTNHKKCKLLLTRHS